MNFASLMTLSFPVQHSHWLFSSDLYGSQDHYKGHILRFLDLSLHEVRDEAWNQTQLKNSKNLSLTLQPPRDELLFLVHGDKENWHLIWKVSRRPQWVSEWMSGEVAGGNVIKPPRLEQNPIYLPQSPWYPSWRIQSQPTLCAARGAGTDVWNCTKH